MDRFRKALTTKNARTTAVYYFGNFASSVFRYFFHLVLLRLLTPAQYGEFLSYLSLTYLLGIPTNTVGALVTKTSADLFGKNNRRSLNAFFYYILKMIIPIGIALAVFLAIFATPLAVIFKAHSMAFIILSVIVLISPLTVVINSYISGLQKFIFQTVSGIFGIVILIALSIVLIHLGFGATGAVMAQLLSGILVVVISFYYIRKYLLPAVTNIKNFDINIKKYTGYSLFLSIGMLSLISTDVLTVRLLLSPVDSGLYSALSILGRMILFGLTPLVAIVLPMASHRYAASGNTRSMFIKLGSIMLLFGFFGASLFSFFPVFFIRLLSGPAYLAAAPLLPYFAFSMMFFALSQFIASFLLGTGRPRATILMVIASILQPICFYLFGVTLTHVVITNFFLHLSLLISLLVFYLKSPASVELS